MRWLVADISNGRTKMALACNGSITSEIRVCPTSELSASALRALTSGWSYDAVTLCSVAPEACTAAAAFWAETVEVSYVSPAEYLPVDFGHYAGQVTLGADRVANAVAAAQQRPDTPLVVIDAGTATTVDVVMPAERAGEKPRFLGGAIAPGVGTMVRALHSGTAQLPTVPLAVPAHAVGQYTTAAIQNGCVRGYRGLLRELLQSMEQEVGCCLHPVLTGGDAPLLASLMPELGEPEPLLTLRGIALCAEEMRKC